MKEVIPPAAKHIVGMTENEIAAALQPIAFFYIVGSLIAAVWTHSCGYMNILSVGVGMALVGNVLNAPLLGAFLGGGLDKGGFTGTFILSNSLAVCGVGIAKAVSFAIVMVVTDRSISSSYMAIQAIFHNLGSLCAKIVVGPILDAGGDNYRAVFWVATVFCCFLLFCNGFISESADAIEADPTIRRKLTVRDPELGAKDTTVGSKDIDMEMIGFSGKGKQVYDEYQEYPAIPARIDTATEL